MPLRRDVPRRGPADGSDARAGPAPRPRVFILSDIRLYREGLTRSLSRRCEIAVVGSAAPEQGETPDLPLSGVDVLLLDATMHRGLDIVKDLKRHASPIKVVVIAINEAEDDLLAYAEVGVGGYVTRDGTIDDVVTAVCRSLRGEIACSPHVAARLFDRVAALSAGGRPIAAGPALTQRERQIVGLVDEGLSNKEIARALRIGSATVKNHVHNILEKLKLRRRGEAAAWLRDQAGRNPLRKPAVAARNPDARGPS